jgi:hypothetical protein
MEILLFLFLVPGRSHVISLIGSEPDLRESQLLRYFHSESIPLQIHMGETCSGTDR